VVQGIHGCQELAAVYQRFDGLVKDYRLEPHHLVGYHGNWYVLATNTGNGRTIGAVDSFLDARGARRRTGGTAETGQRAIAGGPPASAGISRVKCRVDHG
jgi:hypothetical protein